MFSNSERQGKFVYVFDLRDKDRLVALGYKFIASRKAVTPKEIYIFENNTKLKIPDETESFWITDVLLF